MHVVCVGSFRGAAERLISVSQGSEHGWQFCIQASHTALPMRLQGGPSTERSPERGPGAQVLTTSNITEAIDLAFVDRADIKAFIGNPGLQARTCGPACSGALLKAAPFSTKTEQ